MRRIIILGNEWHGNWSLSLFEELKQQKKYKVLHINVIPRQFKIGIFVVDDLIRRFFVWRINKKIIRELSSGDTVIVITPYTLTEKTFKILQQKNIQLIAWLGDDPSRKGKAEMYLPFFKKIFVVDKSWIESVKILNPHVEILPHAFREDIFSPSNQKQKMYEVSFVGDSFGGNAEGLYRTSILQALHNAGVKIALFGDKGWLAIQNKHPEYAFIKSIYHGPILSSQDLNALYNDSQIVLNIHHRQVKNGANQRIFEASGSAAFQITDKQELVKEIFSDAIEQYENPHELVKKVQHYLAHSEETKQKAQRSWTIAKQHTYRKRIERLLDPK